MFEKTVLKTINEYNLISKNDKIIVGVSGGADSISLLYFLNSIKNKFNLKIFAVHINHCMRGAESEQDAKFVLEFCENLGISIDIFNYDINIKSKELNMSLEETGRFFRYNSFNDCLKKYNGNKIAVAHNKNDLIETFFMRLFRGSGLKGLCSIPIKRNLIIRPLLNCPRNLIEEYCLKNNLKFRNDSTNFQDIYTRNKIRLNLIPEIEKNFNPNLIETISNTINAFNEDNLFLENLAKKYFNDAIIKINENFISLNLNLLNSFDIAIKKRILRLAISHFNKQLYNISNDNIKSILDIMEKQSGKMINLPKNIVVKVVYNELCIFLQEKEVDFCYELLEDEVIFIKEIKKYVLLTKKNNPNSFFDLKVCTIPFKCVKIKGNLIIRNKKPGDLIFINGMNKKIKDIFINIKIPSFERNKIPILAINDCIIAISNLFISDNYKILNNQEEIIYLHIWEDKNEGTY